MILVRNVDGRVARFFLTIFPTKTTATTTTTLSRSCFTCVSAYQVGS